MQKPIVQRGLRHSPILPTQPRTHQLLGLRAAAIFKVSVKITDSKVFIGEGLSKKKAEQSAALQLISSIKI